MATSDKTSYVSMSVHGFMPQEEMLEIVRSRKSLLIGIPKELSSYEYRIPLSPQGVELLSSHGHQIVIESNAGINASYNDTSFSEKGAKIVSSKEEVYQCDIILKISPPTPEEVELLKPDQLLISLFFPYIQTRNSIQQLLEKRINAIGFEYLRDQNNCLPVVRSMSEIEGTTAVMVAAEYMSKAHNGKGVMLGGVTGISPTEIVILGASTAGEFAAKAAIGLGAVVKVFDHSYHNLRELEHYVGQRLFTSIFHPQVLTKALKSADAVIASCNHTGLNLNYKVTDAQVAQMKQGSILIDLNMGHGGCFETSVCTDLENPVYTKYGIIHHCVPNMASRVSRTSSMALSNIFAPLLLNLADAGGINSFLKQDNGVSHGIYIYKGILTNSQIGHQFNLPSKDIGLLMAAF